MVESSVDGMHTVYRYTIASGGGLTAEVVYSFERQEVLNGLLVAD